MQNDDELSSQKSLAIIQDMIQKAKSTYTDDGLGWLVWGSLIFLASLSTYFFIEFGYPNLFLGWNIFGIIAVLLLVYSVIRPNKHAARSYVSDVLRYVDIGFTVCLFVIIFSMNVSVSPNSGFGYLLMLYAFLMLVQAGALQFKPLLYGAIVNWLGAIAIFFTTEFKYDMLITAAAVFIGYIIPGFILRAQHRKELLASQKSTQV